jgi:hypothetical protein
LAHVQGFGRFVKTAVGYDGQEGFQLVDFHVSRESH